MATHAAAVRPTDGTPTSSRAAVTDPGGATSVASFAIPEVTSDTALLRVEGSGVCGTDLTIARNGGLRAPTILGHHIVGRVADIGDAAAARWGVTTGDLVALQEYLPCHDCRWCREREYRFCEQSDFRRRARRFGMVPAGETPSLWGGNAEYLHLPPEALVHRLPDGMDAGRAVWLLPLANAFDWTLEAGSLTPGRTVVIVGPGQHGLACVIAAKEAGAQTVVIVGTAADRERLAIAAEIGADVAEVVAPGELEAGVSRFLGSRADLVVNTSGAGPALLPELVAIAGRRARVVETGVSGGGSAPLDLTAVTSRAISVVGARGRSHTAIDRAIESLDVPEHPLDAVPTDEIPLDGLDDLLRARIQRSPVHPVVNPQL